ncbi:nucleoside triphosphate pyrophosphohydrolase [Neobacillus sp. M.A.Huq-85]
MSTNYKLVRDRIPQIIKNTGKQPITKILDNDEYIMELKNKIYEELEEYVETYNDQDAIEELADLLEVIISLARCHGSSFEMLEEVRRMKEVNRGGFKEKIYLIQVDDMK